ncbi:MAG: hypothetical protein ACRC62_13985 [Microcoleus sp.]
MSTLTPEEFVEKWNLSPAQFGSMMGLKSAQVDRLLARPDAARKQLPTQAQSDRLTELDIILDMMVATGDDGTIAKLEAAITISTTAIKFTESSEGLKESIKAVKRSMSAALKDLKCDREAFQESEVVKRLSKIIKRRQKD